jgi:hypothetical protein
VCMIIYKDVDVKNPVESVLKSCSTSHKDGFGVMWRSGNRVGIIKGMYALPEIVKIVNKIPVEVEAAFHFRQATHGVINAQNCHPFPLLTRNDALQTTSGVFDTGVVHNGIIHDFSDNTKHNFSDTMNFVKYLAKNSRRYNFESFKQYIPDRYGKFIIFTPGWTFKFGTFFKDGELEYSNQTYKNYDYVWGCNSGKNWKRLPPYNNKYNNEDIYIRDTPETKEYADHRNKPKNKHALPIIKVVNPKEVRYIGEKGDCLVCYGDVYGTLLTYRGNSLFVENGADENDVRFAMQDIDLELVEDGISLSNFP